MYTNDSGNSPPSFAYTQVKNYFEPDYVSGQNPPITFSFVPFTAVIDMNTGVVQARGPYVTTQQILGFVSENNI